MTREERLAMDRRPETAAVKHGLYMQDGMAMLCGPCPIYEHCPHADGPEAACAVEEAYIDQRVPQIRRALSDCGHDPERFGALIASAVWAELRLKRAIRHARINGEYRGTEMTGAAKAYDRLQARVESALGDLNLTPAAIAKLDAQRAAAGGGGGGSWTDLVIDAEVSEEETAADGGLSPRPPLPCTSQTTRSEAGRGGGNGNGEGDDRGQDARATDDGTARTDGMEGET